ncbi:MAG: 1-(5-phosphoribosyl)-5-[(5-phosphoribosylamino)methylideneamino] imidazole-4-carboxamide isomerase [Turneriella sp.]|nr:1-(5-phosphoribosyl)-5-[(5-phosphoribosylamino)methylideneamino] imidazole-4-carboxamide isomerase [Turneriella sp.]
MKLIPALDILDGKVVRLSQGNYQTAKVYYQYPVDLAFHFADNGAERLHLVDLKGSKEGRVCEGRLFADIRRSVNIPCEVGGGIRKIEDFHFYFDNGFLPETDFLMVGSLPFVDKDEFEKIVTSYANSLLMTVDAWGNEVKHSGWLKDAGYTVEKLIGELFAKGINNYLVTQIKRDGMLEGPDFGLYDFILQNFPQINLIASGGVSSIDDLARLAQKKLYGAIIGRAFYEGKITAQMMRDFSNLQQKT